MANGDGWIFELFGWILGGIAKLFVAMVTGLFGLIVGLFKKNGNVAKRIKKNGLWNKRFMMYCAKFAMKLAI